jgi:hypothetical protein
LDISTIIPDNLRYTPQEKELDKSFPSINNLKVEQFRYEKVKTKTRCYDKFVIAL